MKNNNWRAQFKNEKKNFHSSPILVLAFIKLHKQTIVSFTTTYIIFLKYRIILTTYWHTTLKTSFHPNYYSGDPHCKWSDSFEDLVVKPIKSYRFFISMITKTHTPYKVRLDITSCHAKKPSHRKQIKAIWQI